MLITNLTDQDYWFGPLHLPAGAGTGTLTVDDSSATSLYLTDDGVADAINTLYAISPAKITVTGVTAGILFPRPTGTPEILHGDGSPEGLIYAGQGSMFMVRTAASNVNFLYTKTTGVHLNTGWLAINPSGGLIVSSTVAGLGAGTAGLQGLIRAGSSPYDFINLVYDATYGKWVTAIEDLGLITGSGTVGSNSTSDVPIGAFALGVYGPLVTAGMTLQTRCIGTLTEGGTGENGTVSMQVATQAAGAIIGATGAYTTAYGATTVVANNNGNPILFDTGWSSPGAAPTSAAYYALRMVGRTTGTSNSKSWSAQLYARWVA